MLANIPIAEQNKVVYISPSCSSDKIREEKIRLNARYIFRTWPSDSYQGKFLARFVFGKLGAKEAGVIYINNDYGAGLAKVFRDEFKLLGGKISGDESFSQDATNFRAQLSKIKQASPPVVFMPSHYKEAAQLLKQAKELGIKTQFVADAALYSPELVNVAGNAAEGLIVANPEWDPKSDRPMVKRFVQAFATQYHETPDVYAAAGYDLVGILAQVMTNSGYNSDQIRQGLLGIKNYEGITGTTSFDERGEVQSRYALYRVQAGVFVPLT